MTICRTTHKRNIFAVCKITKRKQQEEEESELINAEWYIVIQ